MTDDRNNIPVDDDNDEAFVDNFIENPDEEEAVPSNGVNSAPPAPPAPRAPSPEDFDIPQAQAAPEPPESSTPDRVDDDRADDDRADHPADDRMGQRLERLGGEPAPVITPEEFARLQKSGQVNIDARGRVRTARPDDAEAGVSLRKRRAWYSRAVPCAKLDNR